MSTKTSELFERTLFTYPLLKGIVSELEPSDFHNLLLSGQVLPMSRSEANKFFVSVKCECGSSNAERIVFECIGSFREPLTLELEKIESYWSPLVNICNGECLAWRPSGQDKTCCQSCKVTFSNGERASREVISKKLLSMRYHMCKTHCLENFRSPLALPKGKCRCEGLLQEKRWRCATCTQLSFHFLNKRGENFKKARLHRHTVATFATQEPTSEYEPNELSLEETCCMMDCKERVWEDVENDAFLVFCPRCSTVYKEKDMDVVRRSGDFRIEKKDNGLSSFGSDTTYPYLKFAVPSTVGGERGLFDAYTPRVWAYGG